MKYSTPTTIAIVAVPAAVIPYLGTRALRKTHPDDEVPTWKGVALGLGAAAVMFGTARLVFGRAGK